MRRTALAFLALLWISWNTLAPVMAQPIFKPAISRVPELEQPATAGVGEAIYSETHGVERVSARATGRQIVTKQGGSIQPGAVLYGEVIDGKTVYCADVFTVGPGFAYLCMFDRDQDLRFDTIVAKRYKQPKNLIVDLPYERLRVPVATAPASRQELVYQGAGGGVLRLLYREYSGDMARPAYTQEATYDLSSEGQTEVAFKGVKIAVASAGNAEMVYRVLSGFGK